jgi:homoserine O-acetyltransferase
MTADAPAPCANGWRTEDARIELRDFRFECDTAIDRLAVGFVTYGQLDSARSNAILLCHGAAGDRYFAEQHIGEGRAFDPTRNFIICVDAIGGGRSAKPSDGKRALFPAYTIADMVHAQYRLVTEHFGISRLRAVGGASMGSMASMLWAARHPEAVGAAILWVPGLACDLYTHAIFDGLEAMLALDPYYAEGLPEGVQSEWVRRSGVVMAPHVLSRALLARLTPEDLAALQHGFGARYAADWDPMDLVWRYRAVTGCDLSNAFDGLEALAARIRCPTLFMPSTSDLIFPIAAIRAFAEQLSDPRWHPIESDWGHMAGASRPGSAEHRHRDNVTAAFLAGLADGAA